jgi:hypothetical protein
VFVVERSVLHIIIVLGKAQMKPERSSSER